LRGRFFLHQRTQDGLQRGRAYFRQAIEKDSAYALAYAGVADSHLLSYYYGYETGQQALSEAERAVEQALRFDAELAEAHLSLAVIRRDQWRWEEAESEFRLAIGLNPGDATAHHWYANCLAMLGRLKDAVREIEVAQQLDPLSVAVQSARGWMFYLDGQNLRAVEQLTGALEMDPEFIPARLELGKSLARLGRFDEAISGLQRVVDEGGGIQAQSTLAYVYALAGRRSEALDLRERMLKFGRPSPGDMAIIDTGLGNLEQALLGLEQAYSTGDIQLSFLAVEPVFDPLRAQPRFLHLLRSIGFVRVGER
jgi:tetratricopeptide (TPR) repeat protein